MEKATDKQIAFAKRLGIENPEQHDKNTLRLIIDKLVNSGTIHSFEAEFKSNDKPKETTALPADGKFTTMYVSYAKDLIVAGATQESAIATVNNLRLAFS